MERDDDSRIHGAYERTKGKAKEVVGDALDKPGLQREGQRESRMGEIESERAGLERERDELRSENVSERRRDPA